MNNHFTIISNSKCNDFLKIKWPNEDYQTIDKFIQSHKSATQDELNKCLILYRNDKEKMYKELIDEHIVFSEKLRIIRLNISKIDFSFNLKAPAFFIENAVNCLQKARLFTMNSQLILDSNFNVNWKSGYIGQFLMRCWYFDTATVWYSVTFDQILQSVYWFYKLYFNAKNYNDSWDEQRIMKLCNKDFVFRELDRVELKKIKNILDSCFSLIKDVRDWANYIKHKGGLNYKYLYPEDPYRIYYQSVSTDYPNNALNKPEILKEFKSPIEIDIDKKLKVLTKAHKALYDCILKVAEEIGMSIC